MNKFLFTFIFYTIYKLKSYTIENYVKEIITLDK